MQAWIAVNFWYMNDKYLNYLLYQSSADNKNYSSYK